MYFRTCVNLLFVRGAFVGLVNCAGMTARCSHGGPLFQTAKVVILSSLSEMNRCYGVNQLFQFVRRHKALSFAFFVGCLLTFMFLVRFTASVVIWSDPARMDQPIAGWMTPRYVAKSWEVPPDVVAAALGLERGGSARRATLDHIADLQERNFDDLVQALESEIEAFRANVNE